MTFHTYRSGLNVYTVCECGAYALTPEHLTQHKCDKDWPRYLRGCRCPQCREFYAWLKQRGASN